HTIRELLNGVPGSISQLHKLQYLINSTDRHIVEPAAKFEILPGRESLIQVLFLENDPNMLFQLLALFDDIVACDPGSATVRIDLPRQQADRSRFSCPVGSK